MDDLISRQAAIDGKISIQRANGVEIYSDEAVPVEYLKALPSAQPEITSDGTLNVSIDTDIANVGRILLSQAGTQRGGLYYKDEQPEIIRCLDCKYYDEVNQPYPQMYCRKHSIDTSDKDFCSAAERKDDE